jgi:hypothetical protein
MDIMTAFEAVVAGSSPAGRTRTIKDRVVDKGGDMFIKDVF